MEELLRMRWALHLERWVHAWVNLGPRSAVVSLFFLFCFKSVGRGEIWQRVGRNRPQGWGPLWDLVSLLYFLHLHLRSTFKDTFRNQPPVWFWFYSTLRTSFDEMKARKHRLSYHGLNTSHRSHLRCCFACVVRNWKRRKLAHTALWVDEGGGEKNGTVQRASEGTEKEGASSSFLHAGEIGK